MKIDSGMETSVVAKRFNDANLVVNHECINLYTDIAAKTKLEVF